ncbi:MAG: hypothetical protein ACRD29_26840 [Acidimicrobiales bacterium]
MICSREDPVGQGLPDMPDRRASGCGQLGRASPGRRVTTLLIDAALETARRAGAVAVEAYPLDAKSMGGAAYTGYRTTFERAGFTTVARHVPWRPIMRFGFRSPSP